MRVDMRYAKKNKPYTAKEFENPTSEYRAAPFWSWNCKLEEKALRQDIAYFEEMGFGGFNMHPRDGLDTAYLSEEFMDAVRVCCEEAEKRGMLAYLYDEDRYPSGAAGGLVTKDPQYRTRYLYITEDKLEHESEDAAISDGGVYFVSAYSVRLDSDGRILSYSRIGEDEDAEGRKIYAYSRTAALSPWHNGYTYLDTLNPKAVDRFIEVTHEAYKKHFGDRFGKTIPSIFADEPQYKVGDTIKSGKDKIDYRLAFTPDIPESFLAAKGYDFLDRLPEIFLDRADGILSKARYDYHDHLCERFVSAYSDRYGGWCEKNGIDFTGHVMDEHLLYEMTRSVGDVMRFYRSMQFPGVDLLVNKREFGTLKQCQSAVHQFGREGMLSELYGVTGWDFDFRGHKLQGDWQAALGVTLRAHHLAWLSMKGDAKRDYPASISHQSSWYKEYKYVEDHFARVASILTRGKPIVKLGVIFPIESSWLYFGPNDTDGEKRVSQQQRYNTLLDSLLLGQLDFDLIDESLLPSQFGGVKNGLEVGKMKYDAVLVPPLDTIRSSTLDVLEKFIEAGGKVVFAGRAPRYVDALLSERAEKVAARCENIEFEQFALTGAFENERLVDIRNSNGSRVNNLIYNLRDDGDKLWLFAAHAYAQHPVVDNSRPETVTIGVKGEYLPKLYDTVNGEIRDIDYCIDNGMTYIKCTLYYHDSVMLGLEKRADIKKTEMKHALCKTERQLLGTIDFKKKVAYSLGEKNVLLLDRAEYALDGEAFAPEEEILKLESICRARLGLSTKPGNIVQPWMIKPEVPTHSVTLRFEINSEIEVRGCRLAIEDFETVEVSLNGESVANAADGYYVDECLGTLPLPNIKVGKNIITVKAPIGKRTNLEWCYLLGDFNIRVEGCERTLTPPTDKIGFGSITSQGLPYYGGTIRYKAEFDTPECELTVRVNAYRGGPIRVFLDGKDMGLVVYDPYRLELGRVYEGHHVIEFLTYLTRFNSFASMHNITGNDWTGPRHWFSEGDGWCYEYRLHEAGIIASPVIEMYK